MFLSLDGDETHVWRVELEPAEPLLSRCMPLLTEDELDRAARFRFEKDRCQYAITRGVLRLLLGEYLQQPPESVRFRYNPQGKPELDAPNHPEVIHFNVSHAHGLAVLAFARGRRVGIDIESSQRDLEYEKLAERFFSPGEVANLCPIPEPDRRRAFFACWTRKEAYIKAKGEGLSLALNQFEVSLAPDTPHALLHVDGDPDEPSRWFFLDLAVGPEHAGALVVEGPPTPVRSFQFE